MRTRMKSSTEIRKLFSVTTKHEDAIAPSKNTYYTADSMFDLINYLADNCSKEEIHSISYETEIRNIFEVLPAKIHID